MPQGIVMAHDCTLNRFQKETVIILDYNPNGLRGAIGTEVKLTPKE